MAMVFAERFAIRGTRREGSKAQAGRARVVALRNTPLPQILSGAIFAAVLLSLPYPVHAGGYGYAYGPGPVYGYGYPHPNAGYPGYPRQTASAGARAPYAAHSAEPDEQKDSGSPGTEIRITGMRFAPGSIAVKAGETVVWHQDDGVPHQIQSRDGRLTSSRLARGQSYSKAFDAPGQYDYYCALHPGMKGTIVVE